MTTTTDAASVRYTIDLDPAARERLSKLAKAYQLTQGEVIEVLVEDIDTPEPDTFLDKMLKSKRQEKVEGRVKKRKLMGVLRKMSPEQLADLEAMAAAAK